MPAPASSRTRARAATQTAIEPLAGLLDHLAHIPDLRRPQGIRYPLPAILAMVVCAMSGSGHDSATAAVEWAHRAEAALLMRGWVCRSTPWPGGCPSPRSAPSPSCSAASIPTPSPAPAPPTPRRSRPTQAAPPARHTPDHVPEREHRRARPAPPRARWVCLAADGKAMRGSRRGDGTRTGVFHLARHSDRVVTTAEPIGRKHAETAAFADALDRLEPEDLAGCLITADALHTVRTHASYLHRRGAHYLFYVKANRQALHERLAGLPWRKVDWAHDEGWQRNRGRFERRR